nr:MAG: polyprotein 1 [Picornavirales sp.]
MEQIAFGSMPCWMPSGQSFMSHVGITPFGKEWVYEHEPTPQVAKIWSVKEEQVVAYFSSPRGKSLVVNWSDCVPELVIRGDHCSMQNFVVEFLQGVPTMSVLFDLSQKTTSETVRDEWDAWVLDDVAMQMRLMLKDVTLLAQMGMIDVSFVSLAPVMDEVCKVLQNVWETLKGLNIESVIAKRVYGVISFLIHLASGNMTEMHYVHSLLDLFVLCGWETTTVAVLVQKVLGVRGSLLRSQNPQIVAQMTGDFQPIVSLIFSVVCMLYFGVLPSNKDSKGFLRSFGDFGNAARAVTGCDGAIRVCVNAFKSAYDFFEEKVTGVSPSMRDLVNADDTLSPWIARVYALHDIFKQTGHLTEESQRTESNELMEIGRKFKRDLSLLRLPPTLWNTFLEVYMKAEKMDNYRAQSEFLDAPRVPPLVVWLYGDTSVGKSTLVNFLSIDLLTKSGQCKDPDTVYKHIFCRNVDTDFWDGYTPNHKVVVYDDFSSKIPGNDKCSQVSEIIQCANIMPFPLHVAELEEKKSARFKSELVLITSNLKEPDMREMNCPDAIRRRRDFVVRVKVKPEFLKMTHKYGTGPPPTAVLDRQKVQRVFGTEKLLYTEVYEFQLENNMNNEVISQWMPYEALLDILLASYCENIKRGGKYIEEMKARARANLTAEMGDEPLPTMWTSMERVRVERQLVERFQKSFTRIQALNFLNSIDELLLSEPENPARLLKMKGIVFSALANSDGLPSEALSLECPQCKNVSFFTRWKHRYAHWRSGSVCPHQTLTTPEIFCQELQSYVPKFLSTIKRNAVSIALGSVVSVLTIWLLATRGKKVETPIDKIVQAQSMYEVAPRSVKVVAKKLQVRSQRGNIRSEYGKNVEDALSKLLKKNQFLVTCPRTMKSVNALFLVGKYCIMPLHFLEHLNDGENIVLMNKNVGKFQEQYSRENVCVMEESDVALYELSSKLLPSRPDIRTLFVGEHELAKTRRGEFVLQHIGMDVTHIQARGMALEEIFDQESEPLVYKVPGGAKDIKLVRGHVYFACTKEGQCGSPVVCIGEGLHGCIVGIHVAGTHGGNDMGFSALVTRELVDELMSVANPIAGPETTLPLSEIATPRCEMGEVPYEHVGVLDQRWMMTGMVKTMLRESPIHDMVQTHITAPARLRPFTKDGKKISPMIEGLSGAFDNNALMDTKLLNSCIEDVAEMVARATFADDFSVLSEGEAINGIIGEDYVDAINMGSSPGFPLTKLSPGSGKRHLFEGELPNATIGNGDLRKELDKMDASLAKKEIPEVYFVCTLKDERRSLEKVADGKTRVFAASNVAHVIRFRQYFLRFAAAYMKRRADCEHAIGIDVYSREWEMLLQQMKVKGSKWMALDFKAFDKSITSQMMWAVFSVIKRSFELKGVVVPDEMEMLFGCVAEPRYIIYNDVWQMSRTHPSGEPMTAVLNSILVSILYRYCFVKIASSVDPMKASSEQLRHCVSLCSYGDDNIATVHPSCSWFNQQALTAAMREIGMQMTPAQKNTEMKVYEKCDEVTFLQRHWQWSEKHGVHVPLRKVKDIVEMVNWIRTGNDPHEQVCLNVDDALYELHFHGVSVYNMWRGKFETALNLMDIKHVTLSYGEQLRLWNERYRV